MKKNLFYLFFSLFVLVFGQIYEHFSHGVYSNYMIFAFLFPLLGLFLPNLLLCLLPKKGAEKSKGNNGEKERSSGSVTDEKNFSFWKWGIATLTVGSLYKGILEIYGTSSHLELSYLIVGCGFCLLGCILFFTGVKREENISTSQRKAAP